jgi:hypothetical protein
MEFNALIALQVAIVAGLVVCAGAWGLYIWLKHDAEKTHHQTEQPR